MKRILIVLISFFCFFESEASQSNSASKTVDNLRIHSTGFDSKLLTVTLEVFDNIDLKGVPFYIISNNSFIDNTNKSKEFKYSDFYTRSNDVDIEGSRIIVFKKDFPYDFIKVSNFGYVIPIESNVKDVLKIYNRNLYFKFNNLSLRSDINSLVEWKTDRSVDAIKKLIRKDEEFKTFFNDFSKCVKQKNEECLFKVSTEFKDAAIEWTLKQSEVNCSKMSEDGEYKAENFKNEIKNIKKIIVNWSLYEQFIDLKDPDIYVAATEMNFGKNYRLDVRLLGDGCVASSKFSLTVIKDDNKKSIIILSLMSGEAG